MGCSRPTRAFIATQFINQFSFQGNLTFCLKSIETLMTSVVGNHQFVCFLISNI